jgi:hypothetical protein
MANVNRKNTIIRFVPYFLIPWINVNNVKQRTLINGADLFNTPPSIKPVIKFTVANIAIKIHSKMVVLFSFRAFVSNYIVFNFYYDCATILIALQNTKVLANVG